jgi:hypothetical protein
MSALRLFDKFQKLLDVTWGSIADGQTLKRSGTNIIGYTPGGGSGDVVGPASAVSGRIASYADTTGKLIADGGKLATDVVTGPASATTGNIASYNGTSGKIVQDGAKLAADLVVGPASSVANEVALFSGTGGKTITRATGTGYVTVVNGVYQTPTAVDMVGRMPKGYLWGLTMSNNATDAVNDIDIAVGEARDSTNAVDMTLGSALTKQRLDAVWVVGNNQGGLDTGTIANATYFVWLIERTDGTVVDVLFSLSATAPTMPANYTYKRRIGAIVRASAAIIAFSQMGDQFLWVTPTYDLVTTATTTAALYTLRLPVGIKVIADVYAEGYKAADIPSVYFSSPDCADLDSAAYWTMYPQVAGQIVHFRFLIRTDVSGRIRIRSNRTATNVDVGVVGWYDDRGRTF